MHRICYQDRLGQGGVIQRHAVLGAALYGQRQRALRQGGQRGGGIVGKTVVQQGGGGVEPVGAGGRSQHHGDQGQATVISCITGRHRIIPRDWIRRAI